MCCQWRDASLVPVPKKGDLSSCDNWRGISLLDVVGKVLAKVIQQRLQKIVEEEVADSQCGFHCNRGCNDMIFCARQLIEKAVEHNTKAFFLFVDQRKAYDSVPREAMWMILSKYGVPEKLIFIIRSFHDNMQAGISINDDVAHVTESNGLRQGCVLAPTLFILFLTWSSVAGVIIVNIWELNFCISVEENLLGRELEYPCHLG